MSRLPAGAVAETPGNDPVAQGPFGGIVGQGQVGMVEHLEDGFPIIEQFDRQRLGLVMTMAQVASTGLLQRGQAIGVVGGERNRHPRRAFQGGIDVGHEDFEGGAHLMAKALALAVIAFHQALGFA